MKLSDCVPGRCRRRKESITARLNVARQVDSVWGGGGVLFAPQTEQLSDALLEAVEVVVDETCIEERQMLVLRRYLYITQNERLWRELSEENYISPRGRTTKAYRGS